MALSISIVTACYNSTRYLERLHRSLATQTFRRFEWVCVDDCSTDETVTELLALEQPGELGMKVFRLPVNSGGSVALGVAIEKASGDAIIVLDHDDEFLPDTLEKVAADWPSVADDPTAAGLFYQAKFADEQLIGRRLPPGLRMSQSVMNNVYSDVHDGTFALKSQLAKTFYAPARIEAVTTSAIPLREMTEDKDFVVGRGSPVRYYHRDNPQSQTLSLKLSRRWVFSYARQIDLLDRTALRNASFWARHVIVTLRFSKLVHGRYRAALEHLQRPLRRKATAMVIPFAWLLDRVRPKQATIVDAPPYPLHLLHGLRDLREGRR